MTGGSSLQCLTSADTATRVLQGAGHAITAAVPAYIRHKPGETTIIAYRLLLPGGGQSWAYATWCHHRVRAEAIHNKALSLRPRPSVSGPGLCRLDSHTVLHALPNDARLRRLRWYTTPRKLKRSLESLGRPDDRVSGSASSVEILRYKPERRVVARVDLTTTSRTRRLLVRYTTGSGANHLADVANHLINHGIDTPKPIAQLEEGRVSIDDFVDGRQLRDVSALGLVDASALTELAASVHRLHRTPPLAETPRRSATDELRRCRHGLALLGSWYPAVAHTARATIAELERRLPPATDPSVTLHGDLHTKNILVDHGRVILVDLERVATGPAAIDLGFLAAHASALKLRQPNRAAPVVDQIASVIDAYQTRAGPLPPGSLAWHTAVGLVEQALLVVRHLEPGWPETSLALLAAATDGLRSRAQMSDSAP